MSSGSATSSTIPPGSAILNPDPISYALPGVDPRYHFKRFYRRHPADPDLPAGWEMEIRVRHRGKTPGTTYKMYFEPVTNKPFKSKKAVLEYLSKK